MSVEENRKRFREWNDQVAKEFHDPQIDADVRAMEVNADFQTIIKLVNEMDMDMLTFHVALTTSEMIGRLGVERATEVYEHMLHDDAIVAIGELVHAERIMELGGIPEEFQDDDGVLTSEAITDYETETE